MNKSKYELIIGDEYVQKTLQLHSQANAAKLRATGEPTKKKIMGKTGETEVIFYKPLFKEGEKITPFEGKGLNGNKISLNEYSDMPIILNFWFTNCRPCIAEMPLLNKMAEKYKDKARFLSITHSNKKEVKEFLENHSFNFDKIVDAKEILEKYGVSSFPTTVLIDKNGVIRFIKMGEFKSEDELTIEIDKLLNS